AGDVFRGCAEFHGDGGFADHVAGVGAENVHAEHAVGFGVRQDFHEALGGQIDPGARIGGERKSSDIVRNARRFELLLGSAAGGDFRVGVNDIGDDVVIHVAGLPGEDL